MKLRSLLIAAAAVAAPALAQEVDLTVVQRSGRLQRDHAVGEPDLRGGWPSITSTPHAAAARPGARQPRLPDREEFAARDAAVQQLAQRYQNEDSM